MIDDRYIWVLVNFKRYLRKKRDLRKNKLF